MWSFWERTLSRKEPLKNSLLRPFCHVVTVLSSPLTSEAEGWSSSSSSEHLPAWSGGSAGQMRVQMFDLWAHFVPPARLYAVGGRDGSSCLRSVECFDPHTNKWSMCAPMSKRRGGVGVATYNNFLYAVGGHDAPASNHCSRLSDCVERWVYALSLERGGTAGCLGRENSVPGGDEALDSWRPLPASFLRRVCREELTASPKPQIILQYLAPSAGHTLILKSLKLDFT